MALAVLMGVAGLMTGCPGPTDPTTCDCPETEHLSVGETCCNADNCDCTEQRKVLKIQGRIEGEMQIRDVLVRKEVGVSVDEFNGIILELEKLFVEGDSPPLSASEKGYFMQNITEIRVSSTGAGTSYNYPNKVLSVEANENAFSIYVYLDSENLIHLVRISKGFYNEPIRIWTC